MPKRASVSRTSGSTVPRSSPTTTTWLRTLSSARMRTKSSSSFAHVGALGGVAVVRNPVEAEQAHHVIDAQRAAVAAVLADRFGEQAVAVLAVTLGIGRRKAPVLALGREIVGRRAHAASGHEEPPVRPQVRAEAVGGQRQVVIEPDRHAPVARPLLRAAAIGYRSATAGTGRTSPCASVFAGRRAVSGDSGSWYSAGHCGPHPDVRVARGAGTRRARSRWRTSRADRPRARRKARNSRARGVSRRHSRRNCTNASFRKRSLSAATRSYSTNGASRSCSNLGLNLGRLPQRMRPPAVRRSPPSPPHRDKDKFW